MTFGRRTLITSLVLYFLSQILFLINIQFPRTVNFDEFHYIPSAKQWMKFSPNQNWEHPPLGKLIIAVSMELWGDRPIGWRYMSTVFGSLTLVGMYILGMALFKNQELALWISFLTVSNHLLYVQSRIAMLDTFMFAFIIWGLASFAATWDVKLTTKQLRLLFTFTGIMMGLGTACKWFTIIPWVGICFLIFLVKILQKWQMVFTQPHQEDWYRPNLWRTLKTKDFLLTLGAIPLVIYFLTFLPYLLVPGAVHSPFDFLKMQYQMWDGQLRVVNSHPYMSHWPDWAILRRPIWYAFDREGPGRAWVRGVMFLGNPLIMWTGLAALLVCIRDWFRNRNWVALFIPYFYFVFYGCWTVIPRKIMFYYYYYPAGMILSFALGYVFWRMETGKKLKYISARWIYLGAAFGIFIYFFPILAALKIPAEAFRQWMWFASWI